MNIFYIYTLLFSLFYIYTPFPLFYINIYTPCHFILHLYTPFLHLKTPFLLIVGVHDRHTSCSSHDFTCDSGHCVPRSARCNDYHDCVDGSDEDNCGI